MCEKGNGSLNTRPSVPHGPFGLVLELSVPMGSILGPSLDFSETALDAALAVELAAGDIQALGLVPSRALSGHPSVPKEGKKLCGR